MLVDDYDDERTLDEEEDMEEGPDREEEIDNLEKVCLDLWEWQDMELETSFVVGVMCSSTARGVEG